jgi:hypothetical protein
MSTVGLNITHKTVRGSDERIITICVDSLDGTKEEKEKALQFIIDTISKLELGSEPDVRTRDMS